ncbi:MAG: SpoIID/LytB domain-containing protein [Bacteroidales bacterium]|nr:SpoIID/LytB domain-containing protein [Bacteroidales bacterium]
MNKTIYILFSFLILFSFKSESQNVFVSIYNDFKIKTTVVRPVQGKYELIANDSKVLKINKGNNIIYFTALGDSLSAWDLDNHLGIFKKIEIIEKSKNNSFRIQPAYPALKEREYQGGLVLTAKGNRLIIINNVNLDDYVAGVVESECGPNAPFEYYKSQSIICRTYALDHLDRHIQEGFQLCDCVHCQVYKNRCCKNDSIILAVKQTENLVIVDSSLNLIAATFHSNCGGQTMNSEDVWSSKKSYLKSVTDTFCRNQVHSSWTDTITMKDWITYLDTTGFEITQKTFNNDSLTFIQKHRKKYYRINGDSILLTKIRSDFKLKSTFFSIYPNNNFLILKGTGYGHGVGLCQEGAMQMARYGYSYSDIIYFYYRDVSIINFRSKKLVDIN